MFSGPMRLDGLAPTDDLLNERSQRIVTNPVGLSGAYSVAVLAQTPSLYWRVADPSLAHLTTDSSGNSRHGIQSRGNVTRQTGGALFDFALSTTFSTGADATTDVRAQWVRSETYCPFTPGGQVTMTALLYVPSTRVATAMEIFAGDGPNGTHPLMELFPVSGQMLFFSQTLGFNVGIWPSGTWTHFNQWVHLVITYDAATFTPGLWLNGVKQGPVATNAGMGDFSPTAGTFQIAQRGRAPSTERTEGRYQDVAVFERILTDAQITGLFVAAQSIQLAANTFKLFPTDRLSPAVIRQVPSRAAVR